MTSMLILVMTVCCAFALPQDLKITIEPGGAQVWFIEGRPFSLTCSVHTDQDVQITWTRDEFPLNQDDYELHTWSDTDEDGPRKNVKLTQKVAKANEYANFRCFAGNSDQMVTVTSFYVYITGGNVTEADTTLNCNPHLDYKNKAVTWLKDGVLLEDIPDLKDRLQFGHENTTVSLTNAKLTDGGVYTCRIEINPGADINQVFLENVTIQAKPYIANSDVPKLNMNITNSSIVLKCPAAGYPHPAVFWFRDGDVLDNTDRIHQTTLNGVESGQLEIQKVIVADFGQYTCIAENAMGKATLLFDVRDPDRASSGLKKLAPAWFVSSMMSICTLVIAIYLSR